MAQSLVTSAICGAEKTGFGQNIRVSCGTIRGFMYDLWWAKHGLWAEPTVVSAKCRGQNGGVLAQCSGFGHNLRLYLDFGVDLRLLVVVVVLQVVL